jgi:hypothetical protein
MPTAKPMMRRPQADAGERSHAFMANLDCSQLEEDTDDANTRRFLH